VAIPASGSDIEILDTPTQFHEELLRLTERASSRIYLSSLYVGTGPLCTQLVCDMMSAKSFCVELLTCTLL
jgi:hypothetical protein